MSKKNILIAVIALVLVAGVGYAAFGDRADILGASVSVGSADLKLLDDLAGGVVTENLVDSMAGPVFESISPGWFEDYPLKLFNNGSSDLSLVTHADYITANDPDDLRGIIYVEPMVWDDANNDGVVDALEIGTSYGKKTVIKWKTEGFVLGTLNTGGVGGYVLRFSTDTIPDTKQGAVGVFDFTFYSLEL